MPEPRDSFLRGSADVLSPSPARLAFLKSHQYFHATVFDDTPHTTPTYTQQAEHPAYAPRFISVVTTFPFSPFLLLLLHLVRWVGGLFDCFVENLANALGGGVRVREKAFWWGKSKESCRSSSLFSSQERAFGNLVSLWLSRIGRW